MEKVMIRLIFFPAARLIDPVSSEKVPRFPSEIKHHQEPRVDQSFSLKTKDYNNSDHKGLNNRMKRSYENPLGEE